MHNGIRTRNQFYILDAVASLSGRGYLATIREYIERKYGKDVSFGRQVEILRKFEEAGWVASEFGEPGSGRGERRRKFYRVTAPGLSVLNATTVWQSNGGQAWAWETS